MKGHRTLASELARIERQLLEWLSVLGPVHLAPPADPRDTHAWRPLQIAGHWSMVRICNGSVRVQVAHGPIHTVPMPKRARGPRSARALYELVVHYDGADKDHAEAIALACDDQARAEATAALRMRERAAHLASCQAHCDALRDAAGLRGQVMLRSLGDGWAEAVLGPVPIDRAGSLLERLRTALQEPPP